MNTWRAYNAALERYYKFCIGHKVPPFEGPKRTGVLRWGRGDGQHLVEQSVFLWITSLGLDNAIQWSTVNNYYTAIKRYELDHGTTGLPMRCRKFKSLTEGIKRRKGTARCESKNQFETRLPFTMELLWKIEQKCMSDVIARYYEDRLFLAASATGIGGLLRASEFVSVGPIQRNEAKLLIGDLRFYRTLGTDQQIPIAAALRDGEEIHHCILRLKCSKTDQGKQGADVMLVGRIVEVLLDYLRHHPKVNNKDNLLFVHQDNASLTKDELVYNMRRHLKSLGMHEDMIKRFSGHSFRKGGAQTIEDAPVSIRNRKYANKSETVQLMGRWKSNAHKVYHSKDKDKLEAALLLGRRHRSK